MITSSKWRAKLRRDLPRYHRTSPLESLQIAARFLEEDG
jgi:hypothetical protein